VSKGKLRSVTLAEFKHLRSPLISSLRILLVASNYTWGTWYAYAS